MNQNNLTDEEMVVKEINDVIDSLPNDKQAIIRILAGTLRTWVNTHGDCGKLALALLAAEEAAK